MLPCKLKNEPPFVTLVELQKTVHTTVNKTHMSRESCKVSDICHILTKFGVLRHNVEVHKITHKKKFRSEGDAQIYTDRRMEMKATVAFQRFLCKSLARGEETEP